MTDCPLARARVIVPYDDRMTADSDQVLVVVLAALDAVGDALKAQGVEP